MLLMSDLTKEVIMKQLLCVYDKVFEDNTPSRNQLLDGVWTFGDYNHISFQLDALLTSTIPLLD